MIGDLLLGACLTLWLLGAGRDWRACQAAKNPAPFWCLHLTWPIIERAGLVGAVFYLLFRPAR